MALDFDSAGSGRRVNHGSAASLDDIPSGGALTLWAWVYRTSDGANQHILTKDASFPSGWQLVVDNSTNEGELRGTIRRATTATDAVSSTGVVALNTWTFCVSVYDDAATPEMKLYTGTLTAGVAEVSAYLYQTDGAGAYNSDAAADCMAGNLARTLVHPFRGRIARGGVVNRALTLGELRALQFASISQCNVSGTKLLASYGGSVTQADLSGNGHNGTVTSATDAAHVPLGPVFAMGTWNVPNETGAPSEAEFSSTSIGGASAVGASTQAAEINSNATGAALGIGASTQAAAGNSVSEGSALGNGASTQSAVITSDARGDAQGAGVAAVSGAGNIAASGAALGVGASTQEANISSASDGQALGVGASTQAAVITSNSSGDALGVSSEGTIASGDGSIAAVGGAQGVGASTQAAAIRSDAAGNAPGVGASTQAAVITSNSYGDAQAEANVPTVVSAAGSASGFGEALGSGAATQSAAFSSIAVGDALGAISTGSDVDHDGRKPRRKRAPKYEEEAELLELLGFALPFLDAQTRSATWHH